MTTDKDSIIQLIRTYGAGVAKSVLDSNISFCNLYNIPTLSIPSGTWTALTFASDAYDPFDWHGTATNTERINISADALWLAIVYGANFDTNTTGARGIRILDGDGNVWGTHYYASVSGTYTAVPFVGTRRGGGSGKYIYTQVYQNSGGTLGLVPTPKITVVKINLHSSMMT